MLSSSVVLQNVVPKYHVSQLASWGGRLNTASADPDTWLWGHHLGAQAMSQRSCLGRRPFLVGNAGWGWLFTDSLEASTDIRAT